MTTTAELVRHGVDLVEECDEPCRDGIVPITDHPGDMRLGEMKGHQGPAAGADAPPPPGPVRDAPAPDGRPTDMGAMRPTKRRSRRDRRAKR